MLNDNANAVPMQRLHALYRPRQPEVVATDLATPAIVVREDDTLDGGRGQKSEEAVEVLIGKSILTAVNAGVIVLASKDAIHNGVAVVVHAALDGGGSAFLYHAQIVPL